MLKTAFLSAIAGTILFAFAACGSATAAEKPDELLKSYLPSLEQVHHELAAHQALSGPADKDRPINETELDQAGKEMLGANFDALFSDPIVAQQANPSPQMTAEQFEQLLVDRTANVPTAAAASLRASLRELQSRAHTSITAEEQNRTLAQVARLLKPERSEGLSEDQRLQLAGQVLTQTANPELIYQGYHSTCNVAAVETYTYGTNPSQAAKLVADVALTGTYEASDGTVVKVDNQPHGTSLKQNPAPKERSHASEIFQVAAVNWFWQKYTHDITYAQNAEDASATASANGEALYFKGHFFLRQPGLSTGSIHQVFSLFAGSGEALFGPNYKSADGLRVALHHHFDDLTTPMLTSWFVNAGTLEIPPWRGPKYTLRPDLASGHEVIILRFDPKTDLVTIRDTTAEGTFASPVNSLFIDITGRQLSCKRTDEALQKAGSKDIPANLDALMLEEADSNGLCGHRNLDPVRVIRNSLEQIENRTAKPLSQAEKNRLAKVIDEHLKTMLPVEALGIVDLAHRAGVLSNADSK